MLVDETSSDTFKSIDWQFVQQVAKIVEEALDAAFYESR
jgi:hypothetical protein